MNFDVHGDTLHGSDGMPALNSIAALILPALGRLTSGRVDSLDSTLEPSLLEDGPRETLLHALNGIVDHEDLRAFAGQRIRDLVDHLGSVRGPVFGKETVRFGPASAPAELVCPHAIGGTVAFWNFAAAHLKRHSIVALQSRGLAQASLPDSDLRQMAARYVQLMLASTHGPVTLLGYSFGGLVALEMQALLEKKTMDPPQVLLIVAPVAGIYFDQSAAPVWTQAAREREAELLARAFALRERIEPGIQLCRRLQRVYKANLSMAATHIARQVKADLVLLMPRGDSTASNEARIKAWQGATSGALRVEYCDGQHTTLVHEPFVARLVERIEELVA